MLDLTKVSYRLVVIGEKNKLYNIKDFVTNLGWEENKNEIATRISFTVRNDKTKKGRLSSLLKPGCLVGIFAIVGKREEEVARGYVTDWNPQTQNNENTLKCTCYDILYSLQKSQDNKYYSSGAGTRSIITGILKEWNIPVKNYSGPDVSHGKLKYNNSYISDILLEVLDDAHKKGAGRYILRADKGYTDVVKKGSNSDIYVFKTNVTKSVSTSISTADLVTRVKVIATSDDKKKSKEKSKKTKVEATLNGKTEYGIRQRIYTRSSDESLADAKKAAQEILDEDGEIKREITLQAPDVPYIRKGDLVYIIAGVKDAYYTVTSIRHDCETFSMTMEVEYAEVGKNKKKSSTKGKDYNVGDIVNFKGGTHYVSSYSDAKGYKASSGKAKITKKNGSGKAHPWHLIHVDSSSNVYGWVDDGTFD